MKPAPRPTRQLSHPTPAGEDEATIEWIDRHIAALGSRGYTVIDGALDAGELAATRAALDGLLRCEERMARRRGWRSEGSQIVHLLPQKHPHFRSFCLRQPLLGLIRAVLGPRCVLSSLNGFSIHAGPGQQLHIDQAETMPGVVLGILAIHALDDFTRANGATRLVPGSQDRPWVDDREAIERAEAEAVYVEAAAGSVIVINNGVWHAASANLTPHPRRAIHTVFVRDWVRPDWDFPGSLSRRVAAQLTPEQRQLFGFGRGGLRYEPLTHWFNRGLPRGPLARARSLVRRLLLRD